MAGALSREMAKTTMEAPPLERKLVAILAADVVGYSRLMHDDEERTLATLTAHRAIVDELIANGRGQIAGTAGDSVLAEFASVVDAVRCAVAIQQALAQANKPLPAEGRMLFRIGINVGDVMVKDGDIFGDGVNVAARLEGIAEPGGICVTRGVRDHLRDRMEYEFEDLGEHSVKNIARSVRVFRVRFDPNGTTELAASEPPPPSAEALAASGSGAGHAKGTEPAEMAFWQSVEAERRSEGVSGLSRPVSGRRVRCAGRSALGRFFRRSSPSADHTVELEFWNSIKDTEVPANFEAYLEKYPDGEFTSLAEIRHKALTDLKTDA